MREYLGGNGKVFITNLIVTLPSTALLRDGSGKPLDPNALLQKTSVQLSLPLELGTVGIVDGQHRILSYYEGSDPMDQKISGLRQRQNLLVTGIIFPPSYTPGNGESNSRQRFSLASTTIKARCIRTCAKTWKPSSIQRHRWLLRARL